MSKDVQSYRNCELKSSNTLKKIIKVFLTGLNFPGNRQFKKKKNTSNS